MDLNVSIQALDFSLTLPTIFGNNVNHLLNLFGPLQNGLTLTDETGIFYLGEQYELGGETLEMMGSGFAIPGIALGPLIVPSGFPVDVMVMRSVDTGQNFFVYPNGTPNILSAVALVTNTSAEPYSADFAGAPPVCFCAGTRIATRTGMRPVETIKPGDMVYSDDGRLLRVIWAGGREMPSLPEDQRPIVIRANALGPDLPYRTLRVSPNHRIALRPEGPDGPLFLGRAKAFCGLPRVHVERHDKPVGYHNFLLDQHAPILAEGLAVESLLLGDQARDTLGDVALAEIARRLGTSISDLPNRPEAQPCGTLLRANDTRRLITDIALRRGVEGIGVGAMTSAQADRAGTR